MAKSKQKETWKDNVKTLGIAVIIALGFRSILFEPFNIPSGSMIPTLLVGDYLYQNILTAIRVIHFLSVPYLLKGAYLVMSRCAVMWLSFVCHQIRQLIILSVWLACQGIKSS